MGIGFQRSYFTREVFRQALLDLPWLLLGIITGNWRTTRHSHFATSKKLNSEFVRTYGKENNFSQKTNFNTQEIILNQPLTEVNSISLSFRNGLKGKDSLNL